jgi:hypothetical protein
MMDRLQREYESRPIRRAHEEGNRISKQFLAKILRNPIDAGWISYKPLGERYRGDSQPLVTQELFDQVGGPRCTRAQKAGRRRRALLCTVLTSPEPFADVGGTE